MMLQRALNTQENDSWHTTLSTAVNRILRDEVKILGEMVNLQKVN